MFCYKCGVQVFNGDAFCTDCGASLQRLQQQQQTLQTPGLYEQTTTASNMLLKKKSGLWWKIAVPCVMVILGMVGAFFFFSESRFESPGMVEGAGYDTPEEAVVAYLEAFRDGDINRMVSTVAIETYLENVDLETILYYMQIFHYSISLFDDANDFMGELNFERRRGSVLINASLHNRFLYLPDVLSASFEEILIPFGFTHVPIDGNEAEIARLISYIEYYRGANQRSELNILGVIPVETMMQYSAHTPDSLWEELELRAAMNGFDEVVTIVVMFELGGEKYLFNPFVVRYGERWYVEFLGAGILLGGFYPDFGTINIAGMARISSELHDEFSSYIEPLAEIEPVRNMQQSRRRQSIESAGFSSPETAMAEYFDGLRNMDLNRMIGAFAIESFVENIDLGRYIYESGYFRFWQSFYLEGDDFENNLNIYWRRGHVGDTIILKYRFLGRPDPVNQPNPDIDAYWLYSTLDADFRPILRTFIRVEQDKEYISAFSAWIHNPLINLPLHTIEIIGFMPVYEVAEDFGLDREVFVSGLIQNRDMYGADEVADYITVFEIGGERYMLFSGLARYGNRWYIHNFGGFASAEILEVFYDMDNFVHLTGGLMPMSDELYRRFASFIEVG